MSYLRQELEELRTQYNELTHTLTTKNLEVQHLQQANTQAQQNIEHLRAAVSMLSIQVCPHKQENSV